MRINSYFNKFVFTIISVFVLLQAHGQCPTTILYTPFNVGPTEGTVLTSVYGDAVYDNATYALNGTPFGWFNIITGLTDVDFYDRHVDACVGTEISISIWMRISFGAAMNVDLIVEDDLGGVVTSSNINLNGAYTLYTLTFTSPTAGFNFIMHTNSPGGPGLDICTENLLIQMDDNVLPTATNAAPVLVSCIGDVPAVNPGVITDEADNCTAPTVAFLSQVSSGGTCPEIITRTYRISDFCGNFIDRTHIITVDDNISPTASNPVTSFVNCIADIPVNTDVVIDEADNCALPLVSFVSESTDGGSCPEVITRVYSVADACGNFINVSHIINVNDVTLPTASNPIPSNVECIGDVPPIDIAVVFDAADNCAVPVVAFVSEMSDGASCPETITRIYSITDDCGNSIEVSHVITVDDVTNPIASVPVPTNVECIGDVPLVDITVVFDATDNCSVPVVAFVSEISDGASCPEVITRIYSVTDDCGNFIELAHIITVFDVTSPTASDPAPITVECIGDVPAVDITVVIDEADNCSIPTVALLSELSDGGSCPEIITRIYVVADDCGNTFNVAHVIAVSDITNPTASNPAAISVTCASSVPAPDPLVVIDEADNCTVPVVTFVSDVTDGDVCNAETITRTYAVTDDCGNSINVVQTIVIEVMLPSVNAGVDQEVCAGVLVELTASNPDAAVISWVPVIADGTPFLSPLGTTTYTVTASQCSGECTATDVVDVLVHPNPVVIFNGDDLYGCPSHTVNFTNLSTEAFDCHWQFGDGSVSVDCAPVVHDYSTPGSFDVTLRVESIEGCATEATSFDYVEILPNPVAAFTFGPNELDALDTEVEFYNESLFADSYAWDFGDGSVLSNDVDPSHFFPIETGGTYTVTLTASNAAACVSVIEKSVIIKDLLLYYVPNVFTPDGDGFNENFRPIFTSGYEVYDYHLTIFTRWGEVVFESFDAFYGWDGTYGDGGISTEGVYVWQIDFGVTMSDEKRTERGVVTLIK